MHAKIIAGEVAAYPYSIRDLHVDNPGISFPDVISQTILDEYGVAPVTLVDPLTPGPGEQVVESMPRFINGILTQQWALVPAA